MSYNLVDPTTGDLTKVAGGTLYADLPIGSWIKNDMGTLPSGFLKEGDTISQSEYPELYAKYDSTVPYKADTSESSDYSASITFEQITTGYTMPYDGVLNIGANSTAGSTIAYVTVNDVRVVNLGTTSYTGSFVRFRKGDVVKAYNITGDNYILKVAYYTKSLIVKAKHVAVPADFMDAVFETNSYSATETRIGTWIDDKPLYRNVVLVNNTQADFASYHWVKTYATEFQIDMSLLLRAKYISATMTKELETYFDGSYWGIRPFTFDDGRSTQYVALGDKILIEYTKATD